MHVKDRSVDALNIAFLGNQIAYGGGAKSLFLLIKSIYRSNLKIYLYVTNIASELMKKEFEQYVEFVKLIKIPEIVSAQTETLEENKSSIDIDKMDLTSVELFAEELKLLKIDLLHINNSVFSPVYKIIKELTDVKIITHVREWIHWNGIHKKQKYILQNIEKYSDAIICISNIEAEVFLNHPNLYIIPNPFDFQELNIYNSDKKVIKQIYGIDNSFFLVGMMSSFQKNKGVLDFLKALYHLKLSYSEIPNIKFVFLGQSMPTKYILVKAKIKKLIGRISFLSEVYDFIKEKKLFNDIILLGNTKNVLEIINCFDIAVRPSYSGDPWGRDIIEYMAIKKPIVATGSSSFFIENGKTGFLVPAHDYKLMAEKIFLLFSNDKERKDMGESAYKIVFDRCNMDSYSNKILQTYRSLISF